MKTSNFPKLLKLLKKCRNAILDDMIFYNLAIFQLSRSFWTWVIFIFLKYQKIAILCFLVFSHLKWSIFFKFVVNDDLQPVRSWNLSWSLTICEVLWVKLWQNSPSNQVFGAINLIFLAFDSRARKIKFIAPNNWFEGLFFKKFYYRKVWRTENSNCKIFLMAR